MERIEDPIVIVAGPGIAAPNVYVSVADQGDQFLPTVGAVNEGGQRSPTCWHPKTGSTRFTCGGSVKN